MSVCSYSLQVIDLTRVSQELAYLASDADLVVLEGMVNARDSSELLSDVLAYCLKSYIC